MSDVKRFAEGQIAASRGLTVEYLRGLRREHLKEGVDYEVKRGGAVLYSEDAVAKMDAILEVKKAPAIPMPAAPPSGQGKPPAGPQKAEITTIWPKAAKVVGAVLQGTTTSVTVRVHSSANFATGMTLDVYPTSNPGLWDFIGRCPRWKGRW
ncbi:MAG: hypothetical protein FJ276_17030 [Planctomycetes bacterium]|nr:hypothetical protein [Planctomycetota bacterium]